MHIQSLEYTDNKWVHTTEKTSQKADIVFTFGEREAFKSAEAFSSLKALYPDAHIVGCSSSGNILGDRLSTSDMVASAVSFDAARVELSIQDFDADDDQVQVGQQLIDNLPKEDLKHVFILSDGLNMNGSSLAKGANEALDYSIPITGGLAGDGTAFEETWVIANEAAKQNRIVAVGFYGDTISVKSGCFAGWEEFGVMRNITRSTDNVVYEIDGIPALELYKKYLGEYANDLPGSGLRFPISIKMNEEDMPIVRTLLAVDEEAQSLTFAGDVPEGALARLMKTDIDGLIDGAHTAAEHTEANIDKEQAALGLVVSCVGRRLVLNQITDEELESISDVLGENVDLVGFYSYGELAPFSNEMLSCQLHNQTLTLTVLYEN